MKFTPGPWVVIFEQERPFLILIKAGDEDLVALQRCCFSSQQRTIEDCRGAVGFPFNDRFRVAAQVATQEADAHLIAAAPDLHAVAKAYEALEADLVMNGDWQGEYPAFTEAIYARWMEIQALRNAALAKADGTSGLQSIAGGVA
jgi:hypothetical protein